MATYTVFYSDGIKLEVDAPSHGDAAALGELLHKNRIIAVLKKEGI